MNIVEMKNVTKIYGEKENQVIALQGINLTIEKGSMVSVVGASGSGKSTLLNIMGGVDNPSDGTVYIDGKEITKYNDNELSIFRRRKIGFIFQAYHLIPVLTVEENIMMPVLLDHKKPDKEYIDRIIELLGLTERRRHLPNQLSGGQQQRTAIARALANNPSLVLADEPTGALDSKNGQEVMDLLTKSVHDMGQTLVIITHNMDLAKEADRIIKIKDGKIMEDSNGEL
ncbi:MAG: ABC transporter ATP-binding protein [Eubacterium sp.]|nr:ABC transporter ATP-binding protein [Eubacterium sp.]